MLIPFTTAADFIAFLLEDSRFQPRHVIDAVQQGYIFRGQSSRQWQLIPSAHRPGNRLAAFTSQTPYPALKERDLYKYLGIHMHAELRAVYLFLEQADKIGIATPIDYRALHEHQDVLIAAVKRQEYDWNTPFPNLGVVPGFALAQHQGVPTRLLDWTESPLVAAYFAAVGLSKRLNPTYRYDQGAELAVFMLDTYAVGRSTEVALIFAPRHINNHLRAQRGVFVYLPKANAFWLKNGEWPSLENGLNTTVESREGLDVATLPPNEADELLRLLCRYEVTRHHLMPNLDHAARAFQYLQALFPSLDELSNRD